MKQTPIEKTTIRLPEERIRIGSKHKGTSIFINEILYLEAYENYTFLHLQSGVKLLSSKPLKYYENLFEHKGFIRTHRSFLVQLTHIRAYECKYRLLHLSDNKILSVSYRKQYQISKIIKNSTAKNVA